MILKVRSAMARANSTRITNQIYPLGRLQRRKVHLTQGALLETISPGCHTIMKPDNSCHGNEPSCKVKASSIYYSTQIHCTPDTYTVKSQAPVILQLPAIDREEHQGWDIHCSCIHAKFSASVSTAQWTVLR